MKDPSLTMDQTTELIRNKNVVAVIAFRHTDIYATDAVPGERPARVVALDPRGQFHKVRHHTRDPEVVPGLVEL